jgi:hypothetical protein
MLPPCLLPGTQLQQQGRDWAAPGDEEALVRSFVPSAFDGQSVPSLLSL